MRGREWSELAGVEYGREWSELAEVEYGAGVE